MALDILETTPLPEIEGRFNAMHQASRSGPAWSKAQRLVFLGKLRDVATTARHDIAAAISEDFGNRAVEETMMAEIMPSISMIQHTAKHLAAWMKPEKRSTAPTFWPATTRVHYQPKGVVLIVAPWNYPFQLSIIPLAAALAAGNRVILKPSEFTPRTSSLLKERLEAALGPDVVTVATGGPDVAAALSGFPFDHILFTGSTAVGYKVMAAAARHLTPVTLELGGKSPAIVHEAADVTKSAERIVRGKLLNAGQTCIAPDYALVQRARMPAFLDAYRSVTKRFYPRVLDNAQYTSIVNGRHYDRLMALLADARTRGAAIEVVDPAGELPMGEAGSSNTRKIAPVLLTNVKDDMAIMQEEIFGPLLPVVPYDTLDDALAYVNARPRPLALYYFDTDNNRIADVLKGTTSGGVTINDTLLHVAQEDAPFGGIGPSGMGAYHGREGFLAFSHAKTVLHQSRFAMTGLADPPYGAAFNTIMKAAMRMAGGGRG